MSSNDPAAAPAASSSTGRVLLWTQVLLSVAILVASGAALYSHWATAGNLWTWSSLSGALAVLMIVFAITSARSRHALRRYLVEANDDLRDAVARGTAGDEALRASEQSNASSEQSLSESIKRGLLGEKKLRIAVARGIETDARLQHAVESGLEGDANLSIAIAEGIAGEQSLRVSVAAGLVGAEALRVSVAQGIEGAEALRISLEQGLDAATTTLAVVDTVDAAITLYAPDGHILLTNDTARSLAIVARAGELDPLEFGDDRVTLIPRFDQVLARAARGLLVTRRAYWVGSGDAQRAMMSTSRYVKRASGELIGTVVASHDVTPLARTRDEFLETVSHELRTPLTSMIGYLEIIEDSLDVEGAGIAREFEIVTRNTDRLLLMIDDLLLTARGDVPADLHPVDVAAVAVNSLNSLAHLATEREVTLVAGYCQPVIIDIDAGQIANAFDKVLSNAIKFNRPGGTVELSVRTDAKFAIISVADTGIGMSDDDQKRIFERFYRAPSTRTDVVAGVGLGLSTAKLIVDAHHGSITAVSSPGVGTTIEISLPLLTDDSTPTTAEPVSELVV